MGCSIRRWQVSGLALALGFALAPAALAAGPTYVVKGSDSSGSTAKAEPTSPEPARMVPLDHPERDAVRIVERDVSKPAATVSRELRQQPVYPDLIELEVGVQRVLIDPERDYQHKPWGGLDEDHSIIQAQRQARPRDSRPQRRGTHVIHGSPQGEAAAPEPAAIIPVPHNAQPPDRSPEQTPSPERGDEAPRKMARSSD